MVSYGIVFVWFIFQKVVIILRIMYLILSARNKVTNF